MPPRRSASSRNANGAANGNVKKEKEVPVVATIDDGDDETEEMAEIELSSDEEASDDECALIVLKRPPVTERTVEEVEVGFVTDIGISVVHKCRMTHNLGRLWRMMTLQCVERAPDPSMPRRRTGTSRSTLRRRDLP